MRPLIVIRGLHEILGTPDSGPLEFSYLDRINLRSHKRERVFHSTDAAFERVISVLDPGAQRLLLSTETTTTQPNFVIADRSTHESIRVTQFPDPLPEITRATHVKIDYQRADGLPLHGDLYLPYGASGGVSLPTIVWGYPHQVSPGGARPPSKVSLRYIPPPSPPSPVPLVTQGYAVFEADMSLVGGAEANDSNNEQLASDAEAAVTKLVDLGIADRSRIGVAGHSYGAFMVANLLANTQLFRAGVALSGLYNLTLVPFGFQDERRTYWEAPDVYNRMSPLLHADRIKVPLLLIHGANDESPAIPEQSIRMFEALQDLDSTARLVILPYEFHRPRARESALISYSEMLAWFDRYLKGDGENGNARASEKAE